MVATGAGYRRDGFQGQTGKPISGWETGRCVSWDQVALDRKLAVAAKAQRPKMNIIITTGYSAPKDDEIPQGSLFAAVRAGCLAEAEERTLGSLENKARGVHGACKEWTGLPWCTQ